MKSFFSNAISLILLLPLVFSFGSCEDNSNDQNVDFEIIRYDKLLFELDPNNIEVDFGKLKAKYPKFTDVFFEKVINIPGYKQNDSVFYHELNLFITDSLMLDLYHLVEKEFGDMKDLRSEFYKVFSNLQKQFPNYKKPTLYSFISGFANQKFIFNDENSEGLAFGSDLFLGNKFPYSRLEIGQNTFSDYFVRTYNKDHIVKKVVDLWLEDKLGDSDGSRAIDFIIRNGKKLYILKQVLPEIHDSILLEYSVDQLKWMKINEKEMWSYYIKKGFFYTTDNYEIKRLTEPGPNSQALGMPIKSPGYTGNYFGYKIVSAYMKRNSELQIDELLKDTNAQGILEKSRFKPKRNK